MRIRAGGMEAVVNPDPSFWRGRRVLVTGHTGFKGSWLLLWLENLGAEVFGLALDFTIAAKPLCARLRHGRARWPYLSARPCCRAQRSRRCAAGSCHPHGRLGPGAGVLPRSGGNLRRQCHGFGAPARCGASHRQHAGGRQCHQRQTLREPRVALDLSRGRADGWLRVPCSFSKGCTELVTAAWRGSFFAGESAVAFASARAGNVIDGDWAGGPHRSRLRARVLRRQAVGPAQPRRSSPLAARVASAL